MSDTVSTTQGLATLRNRFTNRSTAFTLAERERLGVTSRLPAAVETLAEQVGRCVRQLDHFREPIHKYAFLRALMETNNTLFYAVVMQDLRKTLPVIYTPTVGEACQNFSHLYALEHGLYVKQSDLGSIASRLKAVDQPEGGYDVIVITDGSRILGLGDLGANGMGIPIGKCSLYVAGAGIDPRRVLPVCLDVGTNNEYFLNHPLYLGLRQRRCDDATFYKLLDEFMAAACAAFPRVTVQFEDFSNNHCFDVLSRYRHKYRCFNDDIQGTGAVIAAGLANALRLAKADPAQQRIVVYGAGSAAVGVVDSIADLLHAKYGLAKDAFVQSVYLVDTRGLVAKSRGDRLAAHKVRFARTDVSAADVASKYKTLHDVVMNVRPTVLIGLAGVGPAFSEQMIRHMATYTDRPIILPLSNPTSKAEVTSENAFRWTNGKAIVASGSPFEPVSYEGRTLHTSQGNNMYVFPGIGLGASVSQARTIPQSVLTQASIALADMVPENELEAGLYPPLKDIRTVSAHVAAAVATTAIKEGMVDTSVAKQLPKDHEALVRHMSSQMWAPVYGPALGSKL